MTVAGRSWDEDTETLMTGSTVFFGSSSNWNQLFGGIVNVITPEVIVTTVLVPVAQVFKLLNDTPISQRSMVTGPGPAEYVMLIEN